MSFGFFFVILAPVFTGASSSPQKRGQESKSFWGFLYVDSRFHACALKRFCAQAREWQNRIWIRI